MLIILCYLNYVNQLAAYSVECSFSCSPAGCCSKRGRCLMTTTAEMSTQPSPTGKRALKKLPTRAMAVDALGLCISDMEKEQLPLPSASAPSSIVVDSDSVLLIVEFDMAAYKRKHSSRAVKKTLSIPEWLNEEAVALGINFSQVLQDALIQKIGK